MLADQSIESVIQQLIQASHDLQKQWYICSQYKLMRKVKPLFLTPGYHTELKEIGPAMAQSCAKVNDLIKIIASLEQQLIAHQLPPTFVEQLAVTQVLLQQK